MKPGIYKTEFDLNTISLGAGVQSSVMALMASAGEIGPMPDAAIFADTGDEPPSVYKWLDWLEPRLEFPIYRESHPSGLTLGEKSTTLRTSKKTGNTYLSPSLPVYTVGPNGEKGMMPRQCTRDYKIVLVRRRTRKMMRERGVERSCQWIGISTDEEKRMKPSRIPSVTNAWPLIAHGMSREDCFAWMHERGMPTPPRSSCVFCPYHSDAEWIRLRDQEPAAFAAAVEYENKLRASVAAAKSIKAVDVFLHASRKPLLLAVANMKRGRTNAT
jgi:hypothetical protein